MSQLLQLHYDTNGGFSQKDMTYAKLLELPHAPLVSDGSSAIVAYGQAVLAFAGASTVRTTNSFARLNGSRFMAIYYQFVNELESHPPDMEVVEHLASKLECPMRKMHLLAKALKDAVKKIGFWNEISAEVPSADVKELEPALGSIVSFQLFKKNPYNVLKKRRVAFAALDKLAAAFKVAYEIRLYHNLHNNLCELTFQGGHSCYPLDKLVDETCYKSIHRDIRDADFESVVTFIKQHGDFRIYEDHVYLPSTFQIESAIVNMLEQVIDDGVVPLCERKCVEQHINAFEAENKIVLDPKQREAVIATFVGDRLFIVTGYPGTGKSSIVACVCYVANLIERSFVLCAPTGKASMRLGRDASTIHRLLRIIDLDDEKPAAPKALLNQDIVIVDEVSMVDLHLAYMLLSACSRNTRLLLLGDANQLPSVRYGNVLADLINTEIIGNVHLTKIYRQENDSTICKAARSVVQGKMPKSAYLNSSDLHYIECNSDNDIRKWVEKIYDKHDGNLCILIPTKKGDLGTYCMNNVIHRKLFGEDAPIWMVGEKVICVRNLYERNSKGEIEIDRCVFNGQCGLVQSVKAESLDVQFDNGKIAVNKRELEKAYCLTVHKSQGSEYDTVLVVLHRSQGACLYRQLLYTAITRAKKQLYIVGPREPFERCVRNVGKKRYSLLKQRLCALYEISDQDA